jgi:hypothetical protein
MTQPDGGQSPYDPPQQPQQPDQGQSVPPPGSVPGEPAPYQQSGYQQAPQGPVYAQGGQPYAYGAAPLPKNSLGVWSLVLGILSVLGCGLFTGIAAIITGAKSRRAQQEGQANNGGMGLAGLIMGWVGTVLVTLGWTAYLVFIGFMVNSPEFQDGFEQEFEQQMQQEMDQSFEEQGIDPSIDPELQDALDQLENG